MRIALFFAILALGDAATGIAAAAAQDQPSETEMAAARRLFRSGLAHAREGDWEDAHADFQRSYDIAPVPTTLLNLAGAQVQLGRLVAGAESYRRFLSQADSGRAARYREEAQRALEAVEQRVASVVVGAHGIREGDALQVDGDDVSRSVMGVPLPLDPGEHTIAVRRGGRVLVSETVELEEGEERRVALMVPAPTPAEVAAASSQPSAEPLDPSSDPASADTGSGGVLASPWLWAGVGAVIVGAVVTVIVLSSGGEPDLYSGNLGPGMVQYE